MGGFVQTVTGLISEASLGMTLMHEHILCDLRSEKDKGTLSPPITIENRFEVDYFQNRNPTNMHLDDDVVAAKELRRFREAGGGTIVELTTGGMSPQPERLAALANSTGVPIVIGAGFYVDSYLAPEIRSLTVDEIESVILGQLLHGAWNTDVRAGLIGEIGCSWPIRPSERNVLRAAVRVQRATSACLTIHPGRHPDAPAEIATIVEENGGDPGRTIICHMDRTIFDRPRLVDLLNRGFVLEWDFFGIETSQYWMDGVDCDLPTDYMRLDTIRNLIESGFSSQITVSHDICTRTRLAAYGGHGYTHLSSHIIPMMRRRAWSDANIEQLLIKTPARLLAYLTSDDNSVARKSPVLAPGGSAGETGERQ